jgi:PhoH-like ATPase
LATKKIFVLDTNVILHDSDCIFQFADNDIIIPMTVLEELDRFKKGNDTIHYHARQFVRTLDELSVQQIFKDGAKIGRNHGRLYVDLHKGMHEMLKDFAPIPDHLILNCAFYLSKTKRRPVILISKDVNLRMKAKAVGLTAEDYYTDKVQPLTLSDSGIRTVVDEVSLETIKRLHDEPEGLSLEEMSLNPPPRPNEYFIFKTHAKSILATYNTIQNRIIKVERQDVCRIRPRNAEQCFSVDALLNPDIPLVALSGKAGTGKTLLALAAALALEKSYAQIFLARPIVPLGNRDMGYLPGDVDAKMDPYIKPLYDNLGVIQNQLGDKDTKQSRIQKMLDMGKLKIAPLAYIRGRSLVKTFFIVDEAQNLTPHEVKTIITRAGEGTKIILTGDAYQIDNPYLDAESNGLSYVIEKLKGQPLFTHVRLVKGERSELAELASNLL